MINSPKAVALNASTYTAIKIDVSPKPNNVFNPISAYTSDNTAWLIATDVSGTDAVPVLTNQVYNNDKVRADRDGTIFYAKAAGGTPNLILHIGSEEQSRKWKDHN